MKQQYMQENSEDKYQVKLVRLLKSYEKLRVSDNNFKLAKKITKKISKLDKKLAKHYSGQNKVSIDKKSNS